MGNIGPTFLAVFAGIITLAMIAVVVSKQAQTGTVISDAGTALAGVIHAAISPVVASGTGFGTAIN